MRGEPPPATGAYAWRRFLRIVPAYWLALTVVAVVLGLDRRLHAAASRVYYGFAQIYAPTTRSVASPRPGRSAWR